MNLLVTATCISTTTTDFTTTAEPTSTIASTTDTSGCPDGFFSLEGSNQCFKHFKGVSGNRYATWEASNAVCEDEGLSLAQPSDTIAVPLRKYLVEIGDGGDDRVFLGARGNGSTYVWQRGGMELSNENPLWYSNNPGNSVTTQYCLLLLVSNGFLMNGYEMPYHAISCWRSFPNVLCELIRPCPESDGFFKAPGSDQCYKGLVDKQRNWAAADHLCKEGGLALAEPKNPIQLRKHANTKYGGGNYWLGGVGTGSSIQFQRGRGHIYSGDSLWLGGYPGGRLSSTYCLGMAGFDSSTNNYPTQPYWSYNCTGTLYAVCEVVYE